MKEFVRGYGYQGGASREGWGRNLAMEERVGAAAKHARMEPGGWTIGMGGFEKYFRNIRII